MFPLVQISAHQRNMVCTLRMPAATELDAMVQPGVVRKALDEAGMDMSGIDGIAFTQGPGTSARWSRAPSRLIRPRCRDRWLLECLLDRGEGLRGDSRQAHYWCASPCTSRAVSRTLLTLTRRVCSKPTHSPGSFPHSTLAANRPFARRASRSSPSSLPAHTPSSRPSPPRIASGSSHRPSLGSARPSTPSRAP